jgi:tripartite-type tricarboxylate transporter receptor subunit TctC
VSISSSRKRRPETLPIKSKNRQTLRRRNEPVMLHGHPFRVNATNVPRRRFLHLAAGAVALPALSRIASAQTYPTRPVHLVVASAAGGPADIVARLIGQWLSERVGQQFLVENRAGGSNNIGTEAVVRSAPDGYTLLLVNIVNAVNASLFKNLNYNFIRDIAPVAGVMQVPLFMEVNPSVPIRTVPEFITYAKANPGKLNMASGGNGTSGHLGGELFKMLTGVSMVHVPYRGGASVSRRNQRAVAGNLRCDALVD